MSTLEDAILVLTFRGGFNTTLVILGTSLLGLAAGIVGVFALLRKRSLTADALSHATLPGIAVAFIAATVLNFDGRSLPVLLLGATLTGIIGILCIQALLRVRRMHEDAAVGIVLSVFFGAGVVGLSIIQSEFPSNAAGIKTFIYGQTAAMNQGDALLMGIIALIAIISAAACIKEFTLVCFDNSFARVDGWPVTLIDLLIMGLIVAVTVAGLQAVGLILVVALLIIPAAAARLWTDRLWKMVIVAGVIGALSGYLGASASAVLPRSPAGAVIVLTCGGVFLISLIAAPKRGALAMSARLLTSRLRIAGDHALETAWDAEQHPSNQTSTGFALDSRQQGISAWFSRILLVVLRLRGRITSGPHGLQLTDRGRADGQRISRNHRLWEQYLISYADVAPGHVDWSVDQVEHVLSEDLIEELEGLLRDQHSTSTASSPNASPTVGKDGPDAV